MSQPAAAAKSPSRTKPADTRPTAAGDPGVNVCGWSVLLDSPYVWIGGGGARKTTWQVEACLEVVGTGRRGGGVGGEGGQASPSAVLSVVLGLPEVPSNHTQPDCRIATPIQISAGPREMSKYNLNAILETWAQKRQGENIELFDEARQILSALDSYVLAYKGTDGLSYLVDGKAPAAAAITGNILRIRCCWLKPETPHYILSLLTDLRNGAANARAEMTYTDMMSHNRQVHKWTKGIDRAKIYEDFKAVISKSGSASKSHFCVIFYASNNLNPVAAGLNGDALTKAKDGYCKLGLLLSFIFNLFNYLTRHTQSGIYGNFTAWGISCIQDNTNMKRPSIDIVIPTESCCIEYAAIARIAASLWTESIRIAHVEDEAPLFRLANAELLDTGGCIHWRNLEGSQALPVDSA
ncbi:hypothetical protein BDK51DRAFT_25482 [Blyttiomyces helicus]|uniref:Uncharacterized protein n=1 Tax=Blyttiomyces helicus TaxID=388810 RepID=A0A4P9WNN9_9FUNG|nr:hypothetical protein BDK51DRAFT_25482 [Blyttiomyces helicus]|eukprot:RKO93713.1 hypothetical protein BDK51DRAFT_25482 [Blyttiomyces helicus]